MLFRNSRRHLFPQETEQETHGYDDDGGKGECHEDCARENVGLEKGKYWRGVHGGGDWRLQNLERIGENWINQMVVFRDVLSELNYSERSASTGLT